MTGGTTTQCVRPHVRLFHSLRFAHRVISPTSGSRTPAWPRPWRGARAAGLVGALVAGCADAATSDDRPLGSGGIDGETSPATTGGSEVGTTGALEPEQGSSTSEPSTYFDVGCIRVECDGSVAVPCGQALDDGTDCATKGLVCVPGLGCAACEPGPIDCTPAEATYCRADGSGVIEFACDPALGLTCQGDACVGACSPSEVENSYVGCEYFPTTVHNNVNNNYAFEVAVANTSTTDVAHVTISGGALAQALDVEVDPGDVTRVELPWVEDVKVCNEYGLGNGFDEVNACSAAHRPDYSSRVVADGAYRLRSDRPVAAYQFAPINSSLGDAQAGTTEASLLLPQTALARRYTVVSYGQGFARSAVAVVATLDNTSVTVTPSVDVTAAPGYPNGIGAGMSATFHVDRGDVVELLATTNSAAENLGDLTGTLVEATRAVQVFGVHGCAWVVDESSCDHLEDVMLPLDSLGRAYVVRAAEYPGAAGYLARFIAVDEPTTVSFEPPDTHAVVTLQPGEVLDVDASGRSFVATADRPFLAAGLNQGDNTLAAVVPTERYRNEYLFLAPEFQFNYAKLVAPIGTSVTLDGVPIDDAQWSPVGRSRWATAIVPIAVGRHLATAPTAFGLTVFGNQAANFTPGGLPSAYEVPGGLDLQHTAPAG